ncbi:MAG: zeta toxin family protein [Terriglobia bacterium]
MSRSVYVIAGSNGAGKTTFAREFLPRYADCKNFVNADLIAQGMSPFSPDAASFRAGRLVLDQIDFFAKRGLDFGFETTLSGKTHLALIRGLKAQRYSVHIFYLWVPSVEAALSRIQGRVSQGGHGIPETVVRRRFSRSIRNFLWDYRPLADSWTLFDNALEEPAVMAFQSRGAARIIKPEAYQALLARYGRT